MVDWSQAEKYYDLNNTAGFFMAILEVEKLFRESVSAKKFPGKTIEENAFWAIKNISAPQSFTNYRNFVLTLLELKYPKALSREHTEEILKSYFTAITDLDSVTNSKIRKAKFRYQSQILRKQTTKILIIIILSILVISFLTMFFTKTEYGNITIEKLIAISNLVIYKALPVLIGLTTVIAIITGILLKKQKKIEQTQIVETKPENTEK